VTDIVSRLRQTRADMLGTDDEQHYWDCHDAADEIERLRGDAAVTRLRLDAAHAEIERLRQSDRLQPIKIEVEQLRLAIRRLADQDATLSVCDGSVTVTMDATPDTHTTPTEGSVQAQCPITAEERAAIERAMDGYIAWMEDNVALDTPEVQAVLYRLRGILGRLQ